MNDAGTPSRPSLEDQIPAHRQQNAESMLEERPRPVPCLSIQVIRPAPPDPDAGTPSKPKKRR